MEDLVLLAALAARSFQARLTKRVQGELETLQRPPNRFVDHLERCLVSALLAILTGGLSSINAGA